MAVAKRRCETSWAANGWPLCPVCKSAEMHGTLHAATARKSLRYDLPPVMSAWRCGACKWAGYLAKPAKEAA